MIGLAAPVPERFKMGLLVTGTAAIAGSYVTSWWGDWRGGR